MLVGREPERAQLVAALEAGRNGASRVLLITGEPGVGKSALLEDARGQAGDALVLSTVGAETESDIAYANLADICRPVLDRLDQLPARQAEALSAALALGNVRAGDRFAVAAATLSLLGVVATDQPVAVIVDDAQWVDYFSGVALAFAANRLDVEAVTLLVGMRAGGNSPLASVRGLSHLQLAGLDEPAARELLRSRGQRLGSAVTGRLVAEAGGNPLALLELPKMLTPEELAIWSSGLDPIPIDSRLQEAFRERVRDLSDETQEALLLLATLGSLPYDVVERSMRAAGLPVAALEEAEVAGLLVDLDGRLQFRHPLIRAAVYHHSPHLRRRRAHLLVAGALEHSDLPSALERRSWHLVAAGGSADDAVADALADAAEDELSLSNFVVSSKLFERSAQLSSNPELLAPRLLRAADCARMAGAIESAQSLLGRASEVATKPEVTVAVQYYLWRIEMWRGSPRLGRDKLTELAELVAPFNEEVAGRMFSDAALASMETGDVATASELSDRAMELVSGTTETPLSAVAVNALVQALQGKSAARDLLRRHAARFDNLDPLSFSKPSTDRASANDQLSLVASLAHLALEEPNRAAELLDPAVAEARHASAVGVLPFRLGRLAWVQFWQGRWTTARATASEAAQLADDTGWLAEKPNSLAVMARIEAAMGLIDDCRRHAREADDLATERGTAPYSAYSRAALGLLEFSLGHDAAAVDHFEHVAEFAERTGLRDSPLMWWSGDLIEAYARQGRLADAARTLERLKTGLSDANRPVAASVLARSCALLDPDAAEAHLMEALEVTNGSSMPFERARTELLLGVHLRRQRRQRTSQQHLQSALATFERLGAAPWRRQAQAELEAAGVRLADDRRPDLTQLTPQEFQVAQNVSQGMSNREIAAAMFLSVKTVEYHLGHAFHKLGVHRRAQLAILMAQHDPHLSSPLA